MTDGFIVRGLHALRRLYRESIEKRRKTTRRAICILFLKLAPIIGVDLFRITTHFARAPSRKLERIDGSER
jgi:hypothetical protein